MKRFIALCIFAIGMLVIWPPGEQVKAANSDQVSFVVDHQHNVVPVAVVAQDNYIVNRIESGNVWKESLCREGGDVEVQILTLVTQHTYLINERLNRSELSFTIYPRNNDFRICYTEAISLRSLNSQNNKVSAGQIKIRSDTSVRLV